MNPIIAQKHWKEDVQARGGHCGYEAVPGDTGTRGSISPSCEKNK